LKGKIPLHYAAREGRVDMINLLLRLDPFTASIKSKKEKLALHFACGEGHFDVVKALLRAHPAGASTISLKGKLPLHFAARWGHLPVAQHLLHVYPYAVQVADWEGCLPLHDAAREGQAVMSQYLIEKWPDALKAASLRGEIPLFTAVRSGNLSFVVCLLKLWHEGGKYVLQNVAESDSVNDWDWNILELCLRGAESNFTGCSMVNKKCLCVCELHSNCSTQFDKVKTKADRKREIVSLSLSKKRLRANADVFTECSCQFLPVHAALRADVKSSVLKVVFKRSGQDLTVTDSNGDLPIHVAVSNMTDKESILLFLDKVLYKFPESAKILDANHRLPIHRALEKKANFEFIKALVEVFPQSAIEAYKPLNSETLPKTPILLAVENDCDLNTIYFLLQRDPTFVSQW
jgi:ankyrin repeat protein